MASTEGGCLCGKVRFRLETAPTEFGACHCGMCRKFTGGVEFGLEVQDGGIAWEGEEHIATYASSDWAERGWCRNCGSNLFWRLTVDGQMKGLLSLAAGALDDMSGLAFTREVYVDSNPGNYGFAGDRLRMTEAQVLEMVNSAENGS